MNKFEKCKTCNKFKTCEYLRIGAVCGGTQYVATSNEVLCECLQGKTADVEICQKDVDIRVDLVVDKKKVLRLWGQIKDNSGYVVENALITLLKPQYVRGEIEYFPIATTLSDCMGFYQFQIEKLEKNLTYKVNVGK